MKRLVLTLAILLAFALGGVAQNLNFDFEDGLQGWTTIDADGDGHNWESSIGGMGHNSNGMVLSYSRDYATGDSLTPSNYFVSPRLKLREDFSTIEFWACALDEVYVAEHFGVFISYDGIHDWTVLQEWTLQGPRNWYEYACDLSSYAGQEVYLAIRHYYSSGMSAICIDDVEIIGEIVVAEDNTHYADAIQICATEGQPQFPLTVNVEHAESGPYYGCLYTQPNPAWFFVKMDEPGDVAININVQSEGGFFDVDFCCWGPFNALPESSEELTQDKVVDCSYDSSAPIVCTIPSEAQTGEYYVLVVTNYANMPGDLTFTSGGGTGSLECPDIPQREWYYEILNENGTITYQYLYQAGDTIVQDEPTHILVRINTLYDKAVHTDMMHEYVYERNGKVYWWNKTLEEFTVLYDFEAEVGDEWEIKVGAESLIMHVDAVETVEYEGCFYRMLRVSDAGDIFSGDIVCGIGHLTSFFPERLMDNGDGFRVEGLRCYWIDDALVFKLGDEDCDAVISDLHGVEENDPSTGSGTLMVYPNPTDGVLNISVRLPNPPAPFGRGNDDSPTNQTYRITNLMGQTVLSGNITAEMQQIDVTNLPKGMYFISIGNETRKFVVR